MGVPVGNKVTTMPAGLAVAAGRFNELSLKGKTGTNTAVGTSHETVSEVQGIIPGRLSTAETHKIKSTSASDTSGGSGAARRVQVRGIDENGAEVKENVDLNGTSFVETTTTFVAINELRVNRVGSGGSVNAGDIECYRNDESTKVEVIKAGDNNSTSAIFHLPTDKEGYLTSFAMNSIGESAVSIWIDQGNGIFQQKLTFLVKDQHTVYQLPNPFPIAKGGTMQFRAKALSGTTKVGADFQLLLES